MFSFKKKEKKNRKRNKTKLGTRGKVFLSRPDLLPLNVLCSGRAPEHARVCARFHLLPLLLSLYLFNPLSLLLAIHFSLLSFSLPLSVFPSLCISLALFTFPTVSFFIIRLSFSLSSLPPF